MQKKVKFFCEDCGTPVSPEADRCPVCGKIFAGVRCPQCGNTADQGVFAQGCPVCGYGGNGSIGLCSAAPETRTKGRSNLRDLSWNSLPPPLRQVLFYGSIFLCIALAAVLVALV
ncbi:MAG: hypothetical protein LBS64_03715 [Spirochaetaceae bacterium]|jgi:hypothetical protein|nr:hypothetical protein [Spirochaetaceae bacterium]